MKKPLKKLKLKNPKFSFINSYSKFVYQSNDAISHFKKISNKNSIKLSKIEKDLLKEKIKQLQMIKDIAYDETFIELTADIYTKFHNFSMSKFEPQDVKVNFIKSKIETCENRGEITCRSLSNEFNTIYKNQKLHMSKTSANMIIKNILGYRYLKTTKKSNSLKLPSSIISSLYFIKLFMKCMKLDYEFIFIDESAIETNNKHFKCWRQPKETVLFGDNKKEKINLLLAITTDSVLHYKLNEENTTSSEFYHL